MNDRRDSLDSPYGLDAALKMKRESAYDWGLEASVRSWLEELTGEPFQASFAESLKSGQILCKVVNAVKPGTIPKIETSSMSFKQMENISYFLRACRALGVKEYECFETLDLYQEKDLGVVVKCIIAFARAIKKSVPEFAGPHLNVGQDQAPPPVDMNYLEQNQPTVFRSPTGPRLFGTSTTATPSPNGTETGARPSPGIALGMVSPPNSNNNNNNSSNPAPLIPPKTYHYPLPTSNASSTVNTPPSVTPTSSYIKNNGSDGNGSGNTPINGITQDIDKLSLSSPAVGGLSTGNNGNSSSSVNDNTGINVSIPSPPVSRSLLKPPAVTASHVSMPQTTPSSTVRPTTTTPTTSTTPTSTPTSNVAQLSKSYMNNTSSSTGKPETPTTTQTPPPPPLPTPSSAGNAPGCLERSRSSFKVEDSAIESTRLSERSTLERVVTEWIEKMTKLPRDQISVDGSFGGWLKSGEVLCHLVNAIQPGCIPKFNQKTTMPFKQMENISLFLRAIRSLGVREHECFDTSDLFDEKDLAQVLSTLAALGRVNGMQS